MADHAQVIRIAAYKPKDRQQFIPARPAQRAAPDLPAQAAELIVPPPRTRVPR
jgi:hypothetical protein